MSEAVAAPARETLDLGWMARQGEWGSRATASKQGLTLADIQFGSYGDAPADSDNMTGRPRGATPRPQSYRVGNYSVRSKSEIWLENASFLYEEALQRQWSSATDVPWHTIEPLPDDIEEAQCQLATFLTEVEFVAGDGTAGVVGSIDLARDFTEMSSRLHISGEGAVLTIFRMGELMAYNDAEKAIYRLCAQDEARHVAFGVMHMRYMAETAPERREEIECYLDEAERQILAGSQNPAGNQTISSEALAILLGGGKDNYDEGFNKLMAIRKRQLQEYVKRVRSAGFGERFDNGRSNLKGMLEATAA